MAGRIEPQRELPRELANAIRQAREQHGWSMRAAARRAGLSPSMWSRLENAVRVPSVALAADLTDALELPPDTAAWLAQVAISDRGRSRLASVALGARRSHGSPDRPEVNTCRRSTTCQP